jgi:hypothetical protein
VVFGVTECNRIDQLLLEIAGPLTIPGLIYAWRRELRIIHVCGYGYTRVKVGVYARVRGDED